MLILQLAVEWHVPLGMFGVICHFLFIQVTLPKPHIFAPENSWLEVEDDPFLFGGWLYFRGEDVSFSGWKKLDGGDSYLQTLQVATVTKVLGRMILKVGDGPVKGSFHAASASFHAQRKGHV